MAIAANIPVAAGRKPRRLRGGLTAWAFAVPALVAYIVFLVSPAVQSVGISLTDWNGISPASNFVGLANYIAIFSDPVALHAMENNLLWTAVTIVFPIVFGLALAMALNGATRLKPILRTIFYLPGVLPLVAIASIWGWLYDPRNGAINQALRGIGLGALAEPWLGQDSTAFWAIMVPAIWVRTGFPMLLYLAALQSIPHELYESARTEGASGPQLFWNITMPSLRPAHYIVLALSFIESLKVFDLVYAMTFGGPGNSTQVLGTWMYFNTFQSYHAGYGTALAVFITLVALVVGIPYVISQIREER